MSLRQLANVASCAAGENECQNESTAQRRERGYCQPASHAVHSDVSFDQPAIFFTEKTVDGFGDFVELTDTEARPERSKSLGVLACQGKRYGCLDLCLLFLNQIPDSGDHRLLARVVSGHFRKRIEILVKSRSRIPVKIEKVRILGQNKSAL